MDERTTGWQILHHSFYLRENVAVIAKELLGKILATRFNGVLTAGRIVETEAYNGVTDRASHAWGGRRTSRTEIMYADAGKAYVYLCYGIHYLFNIVTNKQDIPHAILIRAVQPMVGIETMLERTGKPFADNTLTRGPGNVAKALGIFTAHSGCNVQGEEIFVADDGLRIPEEKIITSPRIGVDYAGEDAMLPYRFFVKDNPYVSGKMPKKQKK